KPKKEQIITTIFTITPVGMVFLESIIPINIYEFIVDNYCVALFSAFSQNADRSSLRPRLTTHFHLCQSLMARQ
ncbi:TPA: hypothetical protein ACH3IR_005423, partial [Salmonella enterica subsp. enterica serovar Paratyphi B]